MQKVRNRTVESGRGALGCYIVSDGTSKPYRLAEIGGIEWFWRAVGYKFITACKSCRDVPYGADAMTIVSDSRPRFIFGSVWSGRFIMAAIVQGAIITGLTLTFVAAQTLTSQINIIEFLSLSFEGPAKWIFLGYIFYMILVVAIAVSAGFYSHFEVGMGRQIRGFRSALAWVHLVGMNIGGAATTITMIFAGLAGSGALGIILGASDSLHQNTAIMDSFIPPIATFTGVLSIGMISGGIAYVTTYLQKLHI